MPQNDEPIKDPSWHPNSIWSYITKDGRILDRNKVLKLCEENADPWDLQELAGMSEEGRQLVRYYVEKAYKKLLKTKPNSFFTKLGVKNYQKSIELGLDPYDHYYRYHQKTKSKEANNLVRLLVSLLRMFV